MENLKNNVAGNFEKIKESTGNLTENLNNVVNNVNSNIENVKNDIKSMEFNLSADFLNSNTVIAKATFLLLVLIIFGILFYIFSKLLIYLLSPSGTPYLLYGMKDATKPMVIQQALNKKKAIPILRSKNEYDGIEFTYSFWMYVTEFDYEEDKFLHVFHKGSLDSYQPKGVYGPNNAPGVYLYHGKRNLRVKTKI